MNWKNRLRDSMLNWKLLLVPKWNRRNTLSEQRKLLDWLKLSSRTDREAEDMLKCKCKEFSDALATIRELEDDICILDEELDKQAHGFESDLEAVMRAKVEQEQRAIRAEEALRLTKWINSNAAGKLQDEFKRLSMQMQSTFEANERLAAKAKTEASELRLINKHLEDLLQQAKEEVESVKEDYEAQVLDLHNQLSLKAKQIDQLLLDIEEKSNLLNHEDEVCQSFSVELLTLKAEVDRLTLDTASFVAQMEQGTDFKAELEQVKMLVKEREFLAQREKRERENLEDALDSAKSDAHKLLEELIAIRGLKNEKDMALSTLQSEVDILREQCEELRHSLYSDELEKEELRKQVIQLEDELKKNKNGWAVDVKESKDHIKLLEEQIKQKEAELETSENTCLEKKKDLRDTIEELENRLDELNHSSTTSCEYQSQKGDDLSHGGFKLNGDSINKTEGNDIELSTSDTDSGEHYNVYSLLKEMEASREKNASMESELKEMQDRYSEISLRLAEVEGERQKLMMTVRNIKNSRKR